MIELTWNGRRYRPNPWTDDLVGVHKQLRRAGFKKHDNPDSVSCVTLIYEGEVEAYYGGGGDDTHAALARAGFVPD